MSSGCFYAEFLRLVFRLHLRQEELWIEVFLNGLLVNCLRKLHEVLGIPTEVLIKEY